MSSLTRRTKKGVVTLPASLGRLSDDELKQLEGIFVDLGTAQDAWVSAAKKWNKLGHELKDRVLAASPDSWRQRFENLQRVADGALHPLLAMQTSRAERFLGELPIEEQERYLVELIPVAIGRDEKMIAVQDLSDEQRKQVFDRTGLRTELRSPDKQRLWIRKQRKLAKERAEKESKMTKIDRPGWVIEAGRCRIKTAKNSTGLTADDVEKIRKDFKL